MLRTACLVVLLLAASCLAATLQVNVTAGGFVPQRLAVFDGDIVVWTWALGAGCQNIIDTGSAAYPPSCGSLGTPSFCSANETFPESCTLAAATECLDGSSFSFRFFLDFRGQAQKNLTYISAPNCATGAYGQITVNSIAPTQPPIPGTPAPTCGTSDCGNKDSKRSPWVWAGIALIALVVLIIFVIAILILVRCCKSNDAKRH